MMAPLYKAECPRVTNISSNKKPQKLNFVSHSLISPPAPPYLADIVVVFDRGDEHAEGALAANDGRRHVLDNRLVREEVHGGWMMRDEWMR